MQQCETRQCGREAARQQDGAQRRTAARRVHWLIALCVLALAPLSLRAADDDLEYHVKAAFLFNFAKFVEWPKESFPRPEAPIVIGVLGDDPFDGALDAAVKDKKVGERPLLVKRFKKAEDAKSAHILFISRSETGKLKRIFETLQGSGTLTVGEHDSFIDAGGMVRFAVRDERVCLDINPEAAEREKLKVSSKLLRLATIVKAREK